MSKSTTPEPPLAEAAQTQPTQPKAKRVGAWKEGEEQVLPKVRPAVEISREGCLSWCHAE